MIGNVFHTKINPKGIVAIRANHKIATVLLVYQSPHATIKDNLWLQKKLLSLYTQYYNRVLFNSTGRFWQDTEPKITVKYSDEVEVF